MKENFFKLAHDAQRQLTSRASILMLMGVKDTIDTDMLPSLGDFHFDFAGVKVSSNSKNPLKAEDVDRAIAELDAMIDEAYKSAQFAIQVVDTWRGR